MAVDLSLAGVIVSGLSLVVSAIAIYTSWQAQRQAIAAQRRIVEIEEQRERDRQLTEVKASLHPQLRKTPRNSYRLYLVNSGKGIASNVRVRLDGKRFSEHAAAIRGDDMPTQVGPNSEVSCLLGVSMDCAPPFSIDVEWEDDSGKDRLYQGTLTF